MAFTICRIEKHHNGHQCEPHTDIQHTDKYRHDSKYRRQKLGHGLCDHLAESIGVVGVETHNIAMCACIKLTYGQPLHFFKHIITNLFKRPLGYGNHDPVIEQGGKDPDQMDRCP